MPLEYSRNMAVVRVLDRNQPREVNNALINTHVTIFDGTLKKTSVKAGHQYDDHNFFIVLLHLHLTRSPRLL